MSIINPIPPAPTKEWAKYMVTIQLERPVAIAYATVSTVAYRSFLSLKVKDLDKVLHFSFEIRRESNKIYYKKVDVRTLEYID